MNEFYHPIRGQIWWADLPASTAIINTKELRGRHPLLVIAEDAYNAESDHTTVLPLTTKRLGKKMGPWDIIVESQDTVSGKLPHTSILRCQPRTIYMLEGRPTSLSATMPSTESRVNSCQPNLVTSIDQLSHDVLQVVSQKLSGVLSLDMQSQNPRGDSFLQGDVVEFRNGPPGWYIVVSRGRYSLGGKFSHIIVVPIIHNRACDVDHCLSVCTAPTLRVQVPNSNGEMYAICEEVDTRDYQTREARKIGWAASTPELSRVLMAVRAYLGIDSLRSDMKKNKQGESPGESDRELQAHVKAVRKIRSEVRSQMQAADIEDWRRWMEVEEEPGGQAVNIPTSYDSGQEEFDALRRLSEQGSWQGVIERLKDFVIDLGKTYGQGIRIGPARIMAEQPLFAMRGTQPPKGVSKVLEVAVRENTYSVEVKVNEDGSLSCDIVGISIPVKEALRVSVHSERGEELATAQSNESGNCRFTLPGASGIDDFLVLTFVLKETAESLLLRIPKTLHPR